jgi:hypothetical protein
MMFHDVTGVVTTEAPTTSTKPTPTKPAFSDVDDDISVYVSGKTPLEVSFCFLLFV